MADKAKQARDIFKLIVMHNRLMPEDDLHFFLQETPDPEQAIHRIVASNFMEPATAKKVMKLYRAQVAKKLGVESVAAGESSHGGGAAASASGASTATAPPPPSAPPAPKKAHDQPTRADLASAFETGDIDAAPGSASGMYTAGTGSASGFYQKSASVTVTEPQAGTEMIGQRVAIDVGGRLLLSRLLTLARKLDASDIYIKSNAASIVRLNARLQTLNMDSLPADVCEHALLSILTEKQRDLFKKTNDLDFSYDGGEEFGRFRVNFMRHLRGVDGIFRLIPNHVPSFEEMGLPEVLRKLVQYRVGIVLITGPKSCGKTTTMAALVDFINRTRKEHIITVEDPIEFVHPCKLGHVNQREVGPHTGSFANALRASLREAPDVIVVGEMRDLETTSLAITAAETGHLVLSTLHTPDAVRTVGRLLDVFPARQQPQIRAMVSESLRGVVSQQLIPSADGNSMVLAQEIMVNTVAVANLIREDRAYQMAGVIQTGKRLGMCLMDESLIRLAKEGRIVAEEALARASNVGLVRKELHA